MKRLNIIKKAISVVCVLTVMLMTLPIGNYVSALSGVYVSISAPSNYNPKAGESVSFTLNYTGDVANIWLTSGGVVLNGFTANKSITGTGNTRTITLSNIQGNAGTKTITVTGGTAVDAQGNLANSATSSIFNLNAVVVDSIAPVLTITGPNPSTIKAGQTVTFTANYSDDKGISNIWLTSGSVVTNGFTGNLTISGTGNIRTLTFVNVQGVLGGNKTISITGGTAVDAAGNLANAATSSAFSIVASNVVVDPKDPVKPVEKPDDWIPNPNTGK